MQYRFRDYFNHFFSADSRIKDKDLIPVLIYGAGDAGEMLVREIKYQQNSNFDIIGFIDDNLDKSGKIIHGTPILGGKKDLEEIVKRHKVKEIIICIPSLKGKLLKDIFLKCDALKIKAKITPSLTEIVDENVSVSNIRNINVEDLLGRDPVNLDIESISEYLKGK